MMPRPDAAAHSTMMPRPDAAAHSTRAGLPSMPRCRRRGGHGCSPSEFPARAARPPPRGPRTQVRERDGQVVAHLRPQRPQPRTQHSRPLGAHDTRHMALAHGTGARHWRTPRPPPHWPGAQPSAPPRARGSAARLPCPLRPLMRPSRLTTVKLGAAASAASYAATASASCPRSRSSTPRLQCAWRVRVEGRREAAATAHAEGRRGAPRARPRPAGTPQRPACAYRGSAAMAAV